NAKIEVDAPGCAAAVLAFKRRRLTPDIGRCVAMCDVEFAERSRQAFRYRYGGLAKRDIAGEGWSGDQRPSQEKLAVGRRREQGAIGILRVVELQRDIRRQPTA